MRKSIGITILLVVLCTCLSVMGFVRMNETGEQIQIEETVIVGDNSILDGLKVTQHLYDQGGQGYLYWDTVYRPGTEPSVKTDFTYTEKRREEPASEEYLSLMLYSGSSVGSSGILDLKETGGAWSSVLTDVAKRAGTKSEHKEWVNLKDYFDYLPLQINVNIGELHHLHLGPRDSNPEPWIEQLHEAFRIPVPDKCFAEITILKRSDGSVYHYGIEMGRDLPELNGESIITDEYCYLIVTGKMADGSPLNTADGRSICGIYQIPYEDASAKTSIGTDQQTTVLQVEKMKKIASLESGMFISEVNYDEERERLELVYIAEREKFQVELIAVDTKTGELLQTLTAIEDLKGGWVDDVFTGENALLVSSSNGDGYFFTLLSREEDGFYRKEFEVPFPKVTETGFHSSWTYPRYGMGVAFDGERLAVATVTGSLDECQFQLAVYEAGELVYQGKYTSSLGIGSDIYSTMKPRESMAVEVNWE